MVLPFDGFTFVFIVGLLYSLMPLTVWTILHGRHDRRATGLWCWGALLSGVGFMLVGLRSMLPHLVAYETSALLGYVGMAMRWASLRRERRRDCLPLRLVALVLLATVGYTVGDVYQELLRISLNLCVLAFGSACIAYEGWQLADEVRSRSARMLAAAYVALAVALLLRTATLLAGTPEIGRAHV